jgi:molecular chaperone GrpE
MPSNGSRHNDEALTSADVESDEDTGNRARGEGEALAPERGVSADSDRSGQSGQSGPRVRDLRASRGSPEMPNAPQIPSVPEIPNVYEGLSPDLTTGAEPSDELAMLVRERDELLDALRRVQADFENYKKRIERQSAEQRDRANERIVESLLPAFDAFSLARAHLSEGDASPENRALLQAAALFEDALNKEGLQRIVADGAEFDPSLHEAVEHLPADEGAGSGSGGGSGAGARYSGPTVIGVLRPGYTWKGRVLRPAMVRVRG